MALKSLVISLWFVALRCLVRFSQKESTLLDSCTNLGSERLLNQLQIFQQTDKKLNAFSSFAYFQPKSFTTYRKSQ